MVDPEATADLLERADAVVEQVFSDDHRELAEREVLTEAEGAAETLNTIDATDIKGFAGRVGVGGQVTGDLPTEFQQNRADRETAAHAGRDDVTVDGWKINFVETVPYR